jgi:hypothetical protein
VARLPDGVRKHVQAHPGPILDGIDERSELVSQLVLRVIMEPEQREQEIGIENYLDLYLASSSGIDGGPVRRRQR